MEGPLMERPQCRMSILRKWYGAFHEVRMQFYKPLFACILQGKCVGNSPPPPRPLGAYIINGRPLCHISLSVEFQCI